jgi:hypothetical protein
MRRFVSLAVKVTVNEAGNSFLELVGIEDETQ